jgi:molybdopterin molybdotransferase
MSEFLQLTPVEDAIVKLIDHLPASSRLPVEHIPTRTSLNRVLVEPIVAPHPLPEFPRSTVDGYAVLAEDTYGASSSQPAYLHLAGEIRMGQAVKTKLDPSNALLIHTGAMLPPGANAVVMLEDTQRLSEKEIEVLRPVAVGENIIQVAEDVSQGEVVIPAPRKIRPQELGGLLALGFTDVGVYRRPRVGIISSGDEIIPPEELPSLGQVRDINSFTLKSIAERHGAEVIVRGVVKDDLDDLAALVATSHQQDDLVLVTAGSSVSARDLTSRSFEPLGSPGILVHGIAIKPGKPTILAVANSKPIVGLPGNPVSAVVVGSLFIPVILDRLNGLPRSKHTASIRARLTANIPSSTGREDYQPVYVFEQDCQYHAEPIFGRSNLIFTLVRANGLVVIPTESTGIKAGSLVDVRPF